MNGGPIATEIFIKPWAGCVDPEDVPQMCQECPYIVRPIMATNETRCCFVSLYEIRNKQPLCESGLHMLDRLGKKVDLYKLVDMAYGWRR